MANTFGIQRVLVAQGPRANWLPEIVAWNIASTTNVFTNGALLISVSGNTTEAANLPTTQVLGIALHPAQAVYNPTNTGIGTTNQDIPYISALFGESQFGTKLEPGDANQMHIAHAIPGQFFEGTGVNSVWSTTKVGVSYGMSKDTTTGYWVVDFASTSNTCATVVGLVQKPQMIAGTSPAASQGGAMPGAGDTNPRILFYIQASTVSA